MQLALGFDSLTIDWPNCTLCIGVFDGVHLGHAAVISENVRRARNSGTPAVALTFDRNPLSVVAPQSAPKSILSPARKICKLAELGLDAVIIARFDDAFSLLTRDEFYESYLRKHLRATEICVGHDFAFGHKREGTAQWLAQRITTHIHPALEIAGEKVSSTLIRTAIACGDVKTAAEFLGAAYILSGVIVSGQKLGRQLGVPTANLSPIHDQVIPASGIYAGRASIGSDVYAAAISVGYRPTIAGAGFAVEAHLLDYGGGDLYGRAIDLEFAERLRDEARFDSETDLVIQMNLDIQKAREVMVNHG
jgi:riboflavin kinase/FMN adenylyltransferase